MTAKRLKADLISSGSCNAPGQIVPFRPRTSEHPPRPQSDTIDNSLRKHAESDDADDFKHRTLVNVAAFVFLAGLTGAGIWLAASISDLRRTQDCVLANRPNCAQIAVPPR